MSTVPTIMAVPPSKNMSSVKNVVATTTDNIFWTFLRPLELLGEYHKTGIIILLLLVMMQSRMYPFHRRLNTHIYENVFE
jgi:hypothetical protein